MRPLLTAPEERALLIKAKGGDSEAAKTLVTHFIPMVLVIAYYYPQNQYMEDRVQDGVLGLYKALEKFDLSYQSRFSTYAKPWVFDYIQRGINDHKLTSWDQLDDTTPTPGPAPDHSEQLELIELCAQQLEESLDERSRIVLRRALTQSPTQAKLAVQLNLTRQRVSQIEQLVLSDLRATLERHLRRAQQLRKDLYVTGNQTRSE